jgi:Tol biopolymer transport system component
MHHVNQIKITLFVLLGALTLGSSPSTHASEDPAPKRLTEIRGLTWSPDGKQIVFATTRDYEGEGIYLWRVGADGKGCQQITFPDTDKDGKKIHYHDANPQWAPNSAFIAFDSDRETVLGNEAHSGLRQVFLCSADGGKIKPVSSSKGRHSNIQPAWSPDGKQFAWMTGRNASADLILSTVEGKELRWIAVTAHLAEYYPSWSSDGKSLIYMAKMERSRESPSVHIYVKSIELDAKPRQLVTSDDEFDLCGVCSPVNNSIAFISKNAPSPSSSANIWLMNLDGTGVRRVTDLQKKGMSPNTLVRPAWSPQADKIAFVDTSKRPLPEDVYEDGIWIYNLTDGSVTEVALSE